MKRMQEITAFLEKVSEKGMVMTLDPLKKLCEMLGDPQNDLPCVHVAGTNGKGSVLSMVTACLEVAGYKIGKFFSPQVFDDEPAVTINGKHVDDDLYFDVMSDIMSAYNVMEQQGAETPTVFEIEAVSAIMCFSRAGCNIVAVECGLGGETDATNIIDSNAVCVITSVGLDHMRFLGDTVYDIAANKAGIFRKDCTAVSALQCEQAEQAIRKKADEIGCKLVECEKARLIKDMGFDGQLFEYKGEEYKIGLCGRHQLENAVAAIEAVKALREKGFDISDEQIKAGLAAAKWHGRFERVSIDPLVILDGAHNVPAANALRCAFSEYLDGYKIVLLFGILADKQYEQIVDILAPSAEEIVTFTPPCERGLDSKKLAEICSCYAPSHFEQSPYDAVNYALKKAEQSKYKIAVCAVGSLYSLNEIKKALKSIDIK